MVDHWSHTLSCSSGGGGRHRSDGWWSDPPHGLALVEQIHVEPDVAAQHEDLSTQAHRRGGVDHGDDPLEARQAVPSGQIRRALSQRVERPGNSANGVHDRGGVPPLCGGRVLGRPREQVVDVRSDGARVAEEAVILEWLEQRLVLGDAGDEEVVAGEAEDARLLLLLLLLAAVVVDGGALLERARPLRFPERGGEAVPAGRGVHRVATAERERVHHVGGLAGGRGGKQLRGGRRLVGEGGGDGGKVGLVGAVGRVVAAAAAELPRCRCRHKEDAKA